jgi:DNA-binding CsgD family transcriptional regulator
MRRRFSSLLPHIKRTCAVDERLVRAQREAATLAEALDRSKEAIALIDRHGRITRANRKAEEVFKAGRGITLTHDDRLIVNGTDARDAFSMSLVQCMHPLLVGVDGQIGAPSPVVIPRANARPLILTLQPLPDGLVGTFQAIAILFISDPEARPQDPTNSLKAAYGLSKSELTLVMALAGGLTLQEHAAAHGITYETARSHLKSVRAKTGTRRQAEIVRLVHRIS